MIDRVAYLASLVFLASLTFSTALMEISFGVALAAWLLLKIQGKSPLSFPCERKMFISLLVFVFLSMISFFWSEFPKQSFRGIFKILQQFLIFWMAAETLASQDRRETALRVLIFVFLFLGLDGMWQYVAGKDLLRQIPIEMASSGPRVSASFHNYGLLASFLVTFIPLLFSRLRKEGKAGPLFFVSLGILAGLLLLFWTRSRGAMVAVVGGALFYLWVARKRLYLGLVILAVFLGFFALPRAMIIHLDAEGREQSLIERVYLWDRAVQVIAAKPWTGSGINTYKVAHEKYDQRTSWRVRGYYAHNGYLQIAAETGLPSLACFLAFLFFYFKNAFKFLANGREEWEKHSLIGILTGMAAFLILGAIDTVFHNPQSVLGFWLLAGWGAAVTSVRSVEAGAKG